MSKFYDEFCPIVNEDESIAKKVIIWSIVTIILGLIAYAHTKDRSYFALVVGFGNMMVAAYYANRFRNELGRTQVKNRLLELDLEDKKEYIKMLDFEILDLKRGINPYNNSNNNNNDTY